MERAYPDCLLRLYEPPVRSGRKSRHVTILVPTSTCESSPFVLNRFRSFATPPWPSAITAFLKGMIWRSCLVRSPACSQSTDAMFFKVYDPKSRSENLPSKRVRERSSPIAGKGRARVSHSPIRDPKMNVTPARSATESTER